MLMILILYPMTNWIKCESCGEDSCTHSLGLCNDFGCYSSYNRYLNLIKGGDKELSELLKSPDKRTVKLGKIIMEKNPDLYVA